MNDLEFDRRARALHAQALAAQSPRVRAQLHHRLQAVLAGTGTSGATRRSHPAHRWSWATAAVLALALAFGAPWRNVHEPAVPAAMAQAAVAHAADTDATGLATLEQDPDFYLWLASSDAVALAME